MNALERAPSPFIRSGHSDGVNGTPAFAGVTVSDK